MKKKVTAIFDVGKTNKKFFLFDDNFQQVYKEYVSFKEILDEDGHPTENLMALQNWIKSVFDKILKSNEFEVEAINFSTYGASFVHLDEKEKVLTPLYNYTKQIDQYLIDKFYKKYNANHELEVTSGSSKSGFLNSGIQLYWLKYCRPEVFKKIKYSLHLPQYLSFLFTGVALSEYTSIGCHTALWNYTTEDYQDWVYKEEIHKVLPPIVSTKTSLSITYKGRKIKVGVGIHDSSSALLPYIESVKTPFILISTGTWSIALNPFTENPLTKEDVDKGCIEYMRMNAKPVKSSRLFLGNEYKMQVNELSKRFKVEKDHHKSVKFDPTIFNDIRKDFYPVFKWKSLENKKNIIATNLPYTSFEYAYHHLMIELVMLQVESLKKVLGDQKIDKIYVDGGFSDNEVFMTLLTHFLEKITLRTTKASLGSALGAMIAISDKPLKSNFLEENYALKEHTPFREEKSKGFSSL